MPSFLNRVILFRDLSGFIMKENISERAHIVHPFEPFFKDDSRILILGSFPSVASRKDGFYYGNPKNRFWKMLALIFKDSVPHSIEEKKNFLSVHRIALYDVIKECTISGSSDSSIKDVVPSDLDKIIKNCKIEKILANGKTASKYFEKYQSRKLIPILRSMPSTSPANASFSLERLSEIWKKEIVIEEHGTN